jgi:hypothetical protein
MGTFDSILNFIIPIGVYCFLGYILYKIPIFKQMIDAGIDKFRGMKDNKEPGTKSIQNITYE